MNNMNPYYQNEKSTIYNGDCLEVMDYLIEQGIKVDAIITDPPYGTTQNDWDSVINSKEMWIRLLQLRKNKHTPIVLFSQTKFSAHLRMSNMKMWKYDIVWDKVLSSGFLNSNKMPLRQHENIEIFYEKQCCYNPQKRKGKLNHSKGTTKGNYSNNNYGNFNNVDNKEILGDMKHPTSLIRFSKPHPSISVHSTQKPLELMEYLIKTYTNEGDLILDFTAGSFSTIVAADTLGRRSIGIELEEKYCKIGKERLCNMQTKMDL